MRFYVAATLLLSISAFLPSIARGQDGPARFEAGPTFSFVREYEIRQPNRFQVGGRFAWNISRHLGLEAEVSASPQALRVVEGHVGGHITEGLLGVKYGTRWDKLGLFVKVRPGFIHWSAVPNDAVITSTSISFLTTNKTSPALDLGGIFEYYISRHWMLRIDAGTNVFWYGSYPSAISEFAVKRTVVVPSRTNATYSYSSGFQYRFGRAAYEVGPRPQGESYHHDFWDLQNDLLFLGVAAMRAADYSSSISSQHRGHIGDATVGDVAMNHPAFATIEVAGAGSSILASYLFHRSEHHRLERWASYIHMSIATIGVEGNFANSNLNRIKTGAVPSSHP